MVKDQEKIIFSKISEKMDKCKCGSDKIVINDHGLYEKIFVASCYDCLRIVSGETVFELIDKWNNKEANQ